MENFRRRAAGAAIAIAANFALASCVAGSAAPSAPAVAVSLPEPAATPAAAPEVRPVIAQALAALRAHGAEVPHHDRIGVVDFSLPSRQPRFFLVDAATGRVEQSWLVAHGSGSDPDASGTLERFSNQPGSNASSRGAFLTADTYVGKHGVSQRLIGLDADNDNALERDIVIHGAPYVDPALIASQGRIGRSQGCLAFEEDQVRAVWAALGTGRLIYAGTDA
ncbi:MAG: murein L,D-transpeptidase catalytic domain family protein [Tsuneonella sp.]